MDPATIDRFVSQLRERSSRNLDRIAALLGMAVADFQTVDPRHMDKDGTEELLRLWSALDCAVSRARVLALLRKEVAVQTSFD